jgi:hypothetical protein
MLMDRHSRGGEWSMKEKLVVDRHSPDGKLSRIVILLGRMYGLEE